MSYETIYRWENKHGYGPYTTEDTNTCTQLKDLGFFDNPHTEPKRPTPFQEGIDIRNIPFHNYSRYGFISREQEEDWFFLHERDILKKSGFTLKTYLVPSEHVIKTPKQCVFDYREAIIISE